MARTPGDRRVKKNMKGTQKRAASVQNSGTEIWSSMLDSRYRVAVHRLGPHRGELTIQDGRRLLYRQDVFLTFSSAFGPATVSAWQDIAIAVVRDSKCLPEIPGRVQWAGGPIAQQVNLGDQTDVANRSNGQQNLSEIRNQAIAKYS